MDPIDILGSLLGRKSGAGGLPDLSEIFGQREAPAPQTRTSAPERRGGVPGSPPTKDELHRQAQELEDLLNVARDRDGQRQVSETAPAAPTGSQPKATPAPRRPAAAPARQEGNDEVVESPFAPRTAPRAGQNDEALVLVRAMLNAAKADGRITAAEQQSILAQAGDDSAETLQFLRNELASPLNVREFAWSVPFGMEQKVYAMSVMAIDVDEASEERYLGELAHGLRIPDDVREQLQQKYRVRKPR